jgi:bifunctional oligoribonuclease and PAP phosphatase NrnA
MRISVMACDWLPLVDLIRRHQTFLLMTHIRPDADGLGAQLALRDALMAMGKTARVVIASPLPPRYRFLDPDRTVIENFTLPGDSFRNVDAIFVLDTGTWGQLGEFGEFMKSMAVPKAVIDHHRTQDDLGGLAFVDTSAEATGRLVFEIIRALDVPLSAAAAHHLFMALALDTGWFRHPNTTAASFALAHELVSAGANPSPLYEQLYECAPLGRLKLVGVALSRLQVVSDGLVAFTEVRLADYAACAAVPGDTEDLINYPRAIDGVEVALIFIEQPEGGTKVSFRARSRIDVSKLCEHFGGGGHKLAAGARLDTTLDEAKCRVLAAVDEALTATHAH